jgi:hypothetical protein
MPRVQKYRTIHKAVAKKYKNSKKGVKKKGLPATPHSSLPWLAMRKEEFTVCEIYK